MKHKLVVTECNSTNKFLIQVIVFNGVSRVIQSRLDALCQLDGFERAWTTLLDMIKDCTCSGSSEVSHTV